MYGVVKVCEQVCPPLWGAQGMTTFYERGLFTLWPTVDTNALSTLMRASSQNR